jgi:polyisoprenoid-binding protein YceI
MRRTSVLFTLALALGASSVRAADSYTIDPAHSSVSFTVRHLGVSNVHGQFKTFEGKIMLDEKDPSKSSVNVTVKSASIDTGNEKRDNHLRSADFFEADKFQELSFISKKVEKKGDSYVATGTLTIKGTPKEVMIPFTLSGPLKDPWGNTRLGAEGGLTINRQDFKVAAAGPTDAGIGNNVKISLDVEATKDAAAK